MCSSAFMRYTWNKSYFVPSFHSKSKLDGGSVQSGSKEGAGTRFAAILMTYITFYTRRGTTRQDASLRDKLPDCKALQYVTYVHVSLLPTICSTATCLHRSNKYVLHYVTYIHISRLGTLSSLSQTQLVCLAERFYYKLLPLTLPEILGQTM
jgi:hypothetical protein